MYTKVVKQVDFWVGGVREKKTESTRVGRAEAEPRKVDVDCLKPSRVSDFNQTDFSLHPSSAEGIEIDLSKDT